MLRPISWSGAFASLLIILLAPTQSGCVQKALNEQLDLRKSEVVADTTRLRERLQQGGGSELSWNEAVQLMVARNLNLRRSRIQIEEAKERRDQQWKTFLPRPAIFANIQSSLAELGNITSDDLSASIIAPLSIPNPITERARAFENALSYLASRDSYELNYRRQVTFLYRIFSQYQSNLDELALIESNRQDQAAVIDGALGSLQEELSRRQTLQGLQSSLAQQLDLPGTYPVPRPETLPELDYSRKVHRFTPGKNYAKLAVRLSAYQIESALLQEKGVKLRQLPFVNVSSSNPAIYDSRSETSPFAADQIFLFGGLTQSFDITNTPVEQIEDAKQNTEFVRANLRQRLDQEMRQWIQLKERYQDLAIKRRLAEERLARIKKRTGGGRVGQELESFRNTREDLDQIDSAEEQLNLEVWIWDDSRW